MGKSAINPAVVGKHSTDIAALKNDLGIVEDGDTATHTIAQGQYVIWQGALYTADAAIASGTTLAASGGNKNLTAVENGGLNALNSNVTALSETTTGTITLASGFAANPSEYVNQLKKNNHVVTFNFVFWTTSAIQQTLTWVTVATIPSGFRPANTLPCALLVLGGGHSKGYVYDARISQNGDVQIYVVADIANITGRAIIQVSYCV